MEEYQYQQVKTKEADCNYNFSWKYFLRQLFVCSGVWNLYLSAGMYQGAPTIITPQLRREANSTEAVSDETASWISAMQAYAALPWIVVLPVLSNYVGRRYPFFISSACIFVSSISFYFNVSVAHLLVTEAILGIFVANQVTVTIITITEYTSPQYRGIFLTFKSAMFGWGFWVSNAMGTFCHWKTIGILGMCLGLYNCVACCFWKESPYWLADKNRFEECSRTHEWLKGTSVDSQRELREMLNSKKEHSRLAQKNRQGNLLSRLYSDVREKGFYKPYFICMSIFLLYNFSGKVVCYVYAIDIIKKITKNESAAYMGMLILDGMSVLGMYTGSILSKHVRRRTMLFTTSFIAVTFLYSTALYLYLIQWSIVEENNYVSISLLTVFSLSISCGPFILATSICGELIPLRSRTLFTIFSGFTVEFTMATMLKVAPLMFRTLHLHGTFLIYAILYSIFIFVIYKILPETKDKTLVEIESLFLDKDDMKATPLIKLVPLEH